MKITRAVVPSLFTVLNMLCGFLSLIDAGRGDVVAASWFIMLAAGFDALDGVMARITRSSSEFGVQIDSLSDVISFGAAPAYLVYQAGLVHLGVGGVLLSSLLMVFAGLRLARFNTQLVGFDKDHFTGLPTPVSALAAASFVLTFRSPEGGLDPSATWALPWVPILLAALMVSKVQYDTLPRISRRSFRREPWKFLFLGLAVVVVFVTGGGAILPLLALFILLGVIRSSFGALRHLLRGGGKPARAAEPSEVE
ncbi:MAG: CDP-diacylglycerol--serine O-phosphatidyltransferase [Bacteroidota bacterium]